MLFAKSRVLALGFLVMVCEPFAQAEATGPFRKVDPSALPEIGVEGDLESFKTALRRQSAKCATQDPEARFRFGDRVVTRRKWCTETSSEFLRLAESATSFADLTKAARTRFEWYQSEGRDGKGDVMFTGYHSPVLEAVLPSDRALLSQAEREQYTVPLYGRPAELVQVTIDGRKVWRKRNPDGSLSSFFTREEIDQGNALQGRGLELAYTRDWFDAFILQMEGSGVLMLQRPDGSRERRFFNYAAQNGHFYVSITQYLREQGVPEESLSIPGIRAYFQANPEKMMPTLSKNPSYVFFQFGDNGPYGVDSVLLSPRHSVAIDLSIFPLQAVMLFQTERPEMNGAEVAGWKKFTSLAVTQDTGGAIKGPGRVDVYWGEDAYAEQASGRMHHSGSLFLAVLPP
ncbi:MAG: MltA domain-containing protein [Oligoflexia bacterium]|nr:MltA domain-containing protein [Oligoflexia bacterium]